MRVEIVQLDLICVPQHLPKRIPKPPHLQAVGASGPSLSSVVGADDALFDAKTGRTTYTVSQSRTLSGCSRLRTLKLVSVAPATTPLSSSHSGRGAAGAGAQEGANAGAEIAAAAAATSAAGGMVGGRGGGAAGAGWAGRSAGDGESKALGVSKSDLRFRVCGATAGVAAAGDSLSDADTRCCEAAAVADSSAAGGCCSSTTAGAADAERATILLIFAWACARISRKTFRSSG